MNISKSSFFKNLALSLFYLYSPLTSCKKSEKSLEPFLRKLRYQPTNYYQQHRSYRTSLTPVQKNIISCFWAIERLNSKRGIFQLQYQQNLCFCFVLIYSCFVGFFFIFFNMKIFVKTLTNTFRAT